MFPNVLHNELHNAAEATLQRAKERPPEGGPSCFVSTGAEERTRTSTRLPGLDPESQRPPGGSPQLS